MTCRHRSNNEGKLCCRTPHQAEDVQLSESPNCRWWIMDLVPNSQVCWPLASSWLCSASLGQKRPTRKKVLLCIWWSIFEIVHWELLPESATVMADLYINHLRTLKGKFDLEPHWKNHVFFQHDKVRPGVLLGSDMPPTLFSRNYSVRLSLVPVVEEPSLWKRISKSRWSKISLDGLLRVKAFRFLQDWNLGPSHRWRNVTDNHGDYTIDWSSVIAKLRNFEINLMMVTRLVHQPNM